eukprot:CAMPEP_0194525556 /NCGR_PEP_ID=MMETSP0253-20130528/61073_1 /TAXON_ID=2966 /ORGANISM="Noctiluca scintillans" /LENGTH=319 /DNA_ID=CAMNT_0039370303 /DNA_START=254 /DNA_END=1213 /DNA_ORIENTATION=-
MIAGTPIVLLVSEGKSITRIQMKIFATMWLFFFGGVVLFTTVLEFQSVHFEARRTLTVVESVYLLAQILTTVGYGDVTPVTTGGQFFVGFFILFSLIIIANVVSEFLQKCAENTETYATNASMILEKRLGEGDILEGPRTCSRTSMVVNLNRPELDLSRFWATGSAFLFFVLVGVVFFRLCPGEEMPLFEGLYVSVITLSTVGFGAVTPGTEAGKVFAAFWMVFGSSALAAFVGALIEVQEQMKIRERWSKEDVLRTHRKMIDGFPPQVDKYEFLKRSVVFKGFANESDVEEIMNTFFMLVPGGEGTISKRKLERMLVQ